MASKLPISDTVLIIRWSAQGDSAKRTQAQRILWLAYSAGRAAACGGRTAA